MEARPKNTSAVIERTQTIRRTSTCGMITKAVLSTEAALHQWTKQFLDLKGVSGLVYWHTRNEAKRTWAEINQAKRYGMRKGVADLTLVLPPDGHTAFLELKGPRGYQTPEQKRFQEDVVAAGALYAVARTPQEVESICRDWGVTDGA